MLNIDIPVRRNQPVDLYIDWEGNYLLIQVNEDEPMEFETETLGLYRSYPNMPSIMVTPTGKERQHLLTADDGFQLSLVLN